MSTTIKTPRAEVGKKMNVDRKKADDSDLIVCSIKVAFPVTREEAAELTGFPLATINALYNEAGVPLQHASLLMTKRELLVAGKIARHIPEDQQADFTDPNKKPPVLELPRSLATDMRFVLDNLGAGFRGTLSWKARGDEVEDVEPLLGSKAEISLEFSEPPQAAAQTAARSAKKDTPAPKAAAAGKGSKGGKGAPKKKRGADAAAGGDDDQDDQTPPDDATLLAGIREYVKDQDTVSHTQLQEQFRVPFTKAHQFLETLRGEGLVGDVETGGWRKVLHKSDAPPPPKGAAAAGVGPGFMKQVAAAARRAPRKPAAKSGSRRAH
jgi:hypothetical protein